MALAMQIKSGIKGVLPVLIDDCEVPGFLLEKAYVDLKDGAYFPTPMNTNRIFDKPATIARPST